jgi:hypothetical protein
MVPTETVCGSIALSFPITPAPYTGIAVCLILEGVAGTWYAAIITFISVIAGTAIDCKEKSKIKQSIQYLLWSQLLCKILLFVVLKIYYFCDGYNKSA